MCKRGEPERTLRAVLYLLMDVKPHTWRCSRWFHELAEGRCELSVHAAAEHARKADALCAAAIREIREMLEWGPRGRPPAAGQMLLLVPDPGEQLTSPRWKKDAA